MRKNWIFFLLSSSYIAATTDSFRYERFCRLSKWNRYTMLQKHFFSSKFDVKLSSLLVLKLLGATVSFEIELSHSCLEHILILKQLNSKTQLQHIIEKLYIFA